MQPNYDLLRSIIATLPDNEQALILTAAALKTGIIIGGTRNKPLGKSLLCQTLHALGVDAIEAWELEEGMPSTKHITQKRNVAYAAINLHVPLGERK